MVTIFSCGYYFYFGTINSIYFLILMLLVMVFERWIIHDKNSEFSFKFQFWD